VSTFEVHLEVTCGLVRTDGDRRGGLGHGQRNVAR
jgi:hypothetical protein